MPTIQPEAANDTYDLIVVGSGMGSLFFVHRYLQRRPNARIAIVEWGKLHTRDWQLENKANSDWAFNTAHRTAGTHQKPWDYTIGWGGGLNCWWALTPRFQPNDFKVRSVYGYSNDWPLRYDDLAPYYDEAEAQMLVAGPDDISAIFPDHPGYPMPPHRLSTPDEIMKRAQPDRHFAYPAAKVTRPAGARAPCCSASRCNLCPTNARFSWFNGLPAFHEDERVDVMLECKAERLLHDGALARGVTVSHAGRDHSIKGDLVVVGANAIHSAFLLLRSGLDDWALGRFLHEKVAFEAEAHMKGVRNFDGGTASTGLNATLWDGPHRHSQSAAIILFPNRWHFGMRADFGRWTETLPIGVYVEDIPQEKNRVINDGGDLPLVDHAAPSDFATQSMRKVIEALPDVFSALPLEEKFERIRPYPTISHVMGTCRMGDDPKTSVVDRDMMHHKLRNLLIVGTSVFPSCGVANPSLTIAALSYRAADKLTSSR